MSQVGHNGPSYFRQDRTGMVISSHMTQKIWKTDKLKPRPNELNIPLNFTQQMFSDVACCSVMFSQVGGQTG